MTATLDRDVARLESFSDAVFGFVATLLVVSIDIPTDFRELLDRLAGFPGFAVGFLVLSRFVGLDLGSAAPLAIHTFDDVRALMMLFSGGFTAVFASFLLLYLAAWRHREVLAPGAMERAHLRLEVRQHAIAAALGLLVMTLCGFGIGLEAGVPLWLLLLLVPIRWIQTRRSRGAP